VRELPTGTVTLLFTDIEGSTRLLRALGDDYTDVVAEHRRLLRTAFAAHHGVEVDTQGDAIFAAFGDAREAVAAAAEGQAALDGGPIRVRMGLHTGTPTRTGEGYVGLDVHLGARIAACGHGGQVLLSKATHDLVDEPTTDLGAHRVKDFDEPAWIFQLGDGLFPPLKTIANTNLPRPASSFIGREQEVADVSKLLRDQTRLLTLTGPGGSGKTRLSIEAAADLLGEFRHGVFWIGLATVRDTNLVVHAVAQTLGAQEDLATHVGEREMLLLLDNLEHVIDAGPEIAELIEKCPNLSVLVTSRELLRVRGEVEYGVSPLANPDALELFSRRSGISATETIAELCRRLDNMPLAIELAAARAKVLSPEQILDRLSQRLDLFRGGRDADPRQQTLRATIAWSYDLLTDPERELFARLAVCGGGCTLRVAEAVCHADLDTLQSLVEKSLVRHTDERFWMLETIREFALERLDDAGDEDVLRRAHAEHFLRLAETASLTGESIGPERPELVRPEIDNLRDAIDWALEHDLELAFRLAIALEQFWVMHDAFEGARRFALLLEHGAEVPAVLRARALRCYAESLWISGDIDAGSRLMEESLTEFERLGDDRAIAVLLHRLGVAAINRPDLERARGLFEQSLGMCRRDPNPKLEADAIHKLAWVERMEGNRERALELFDDSADGCRRAGFTWMEASALHDYADLAHELGRTAVAETRVREALRLSSDLDDRYTIVYALALLARFEGAAGRREQAGRLWGAIEAEELRGPLGLWEVLYREQFADVPLANAGEKFETGRAGGRRISLDEAVGEALAEPA
jgi:predicted ATPase